MTKNELIKYRSALEAKYGELGRLLRNRDAITIEKRPDALDETQHATERELAILNLDRDSRVLRQIRSALQRIADGSFGVCLHCEGDISTKRLTAVPWAAFCIRCQEAADQQGDSSGNFDELLVEAA